MFGNCSRCRRLRRGAQLPVYLNPRPPFSQPAAATTECLLFEPQLAPAFVNRNGDGVRQVQAAAAFAHRQAQAVFAIQSIKHFRWQTTAFRAKDKGVALCELSIVERPRALGGERKEAWVAKAFKATGQVGVAFEWCVLVIIESCATQALVVQLKTDRLDQMQVAAAVGA